MSETLSEVLWAPPSHLLFRSHVEAARLWACLAPTHRDRCGLALDPIVRPMPDTASWHRYVSRDHDQGRPGSELPIGLGRAPTPDELLTTLSSLGRTPIDEFATRGPARTRWIGVARELCGLSGRALAREIGVSERTVRNTMTPPQALTRRVERATGDPRFASLDAGRRLWSRHYRNHR